MLAKSLKPVKWVGSSRKDMKAMPESVQDIFVFALYLAQLGDKHPDAKPLKGFSGAGVVEIVEDFSSDSYRAVYTVKFDDAVYILHVFRKKSTHGTSTAPKEEIEKVKARLKVVEEMQQRKGDKRNE